ncbi:MAG: SdrD B-like domain-containing protein, partial [Candidatus Neomicrothrix subdominans]
MLSVRVRASRSLPFALSTLLMASVMTTGWSALSASPAQAVPGPLGGTVFHDYNANGAQDGPTSEGNTSIDTGVGGVTITAFDPAGVAVGTTTSAGDGSWALTPTADGPYRVEFSALPSAYQPSSAGPAGENTTVQFVPAAGSTTVDLGVGIPSQYCQDNPEIVTNCYDFGPSVGSSDPVVVSLPYDAGGPPGSSNADNPTTHDLMLTANQVGATWGLAYQRSARNLYMASFMKKHSAFGPGGTGAIYRVNRTSGASSTAVYADLNALFGPGTAGVDPHDPADFLIDNGNLSWEGVGKVALGGMAVSDDDQTLFAMNLADRQLYAIPLDATPTAGNVRRAAVPLDPPGCPSAGDVRPFAVQYHEGQVYVGMVCSAESTQDRADLRAYIYRVNPASLAFTGPVLDSPLDYPRGNIFGSSSAAWNPWSPVLPAAIEGGGLAGYPQPILSDIVFDGDDIVLGLRDRSGDQLGNGAPDNPANPQALFYGSSSGDMLRACGSVAAGWTLESDAACGGGPTAGAGSSQGPDGGEYYFSDEWGNYHDEVALGGLVQIPGRPDVKSTVFDPIQDDAFDSGTRRFNNLTGVTSRAYRLVNGDVGDSASFGKASGLGDLVALCDEAPIEIGNRLWVDIDKDGLQDAGETPLAGVTVELWSGGTKVGTAVTDANGQYLFTSSLATDPDLTDFRGGGVVPNSVFEIRVPDAGGAGQQSPLAGLSLTTADSGASDRIDSDATLSGVSAVVPVNTGAAGYNDHTFDIGFVQPPVS